MSAAEDERLAHMAHRIADAFRTRPDAEAAAAVAAHINQFWPPMLRRALLARYGEDRAGLDPISARALEMVRLPGEGPAVR